MTGWTETTLGAICQIKPPKKEAKQKLSDADMVSFVPMNNLGICTKDIELNEDKALGEVVGSYTYFAEGDVLLAKITPCFENGKLGIARGLTNGIGFGSSEFVVFRSKGSVDPEFLFYFLSQDSFRESGARIMTGAVGHKRITNEFIESHPVKLPPLPEQKGIVAILDEAFAGIDAAIANTEKNLANARELFESYLNAVFTQKGDGWEEKKLQTISSILNGYAFKSTDFSTRPGARCIKITNVGIREFVSDTDVYLPDKFSTEHAAMSVRAGNIVIALTRTIIAGGLKVAVVPTEYDGALLNQRVASIAVNEAQLEGALLLAYLSTQTVVDYVKERVNTLMQPNLSIADLRSMPVPVPPRSEQDKISQRINLIREETQRLEAVYRQKLEALTELKQSILQKAFAGELSSAPEKSLQEAM